MVREPDDSQPIDHYEDIHQDLAPETPIERFMAEHVILGIEECNHWLKAKAKDAPQAAEWYRDYERALRIFHKNLTALKRLQSVRMKLENAVKPKKSGAESQVKRYEILTRDGSRLTEAPPETAIPDDTPEAIADAAKNWRDVIAYVPKVNPKWALHLPTGKVIEHLLSLAGDGVTDERLLRNEPWLRPADLAAMRACEEEGFLGPYHPLEPTPPGIRRLVELPPGSLRRPP
jgi:hypothetical protein